MSSRIAGRSRLALRTATLLVWSASLLSVFGRADTPPPGEQDRPLVVVAEYDGIIHPVAAEFVEQAILAGEERGAAAVVLVLRTPGGLLDSTRTITSRMISARCPVVVYIAPSGSRAASAGFLITIAADVAAMAPGTSIGAAHPVSGDGAPVNDTVAKKAASDVAAYARSLADKRGRNVPLAEQAVTESRAFTEKEASGAEPPLVDLVARDLDDLLAQLDGREVGRFDGSRVVLKTAGARVERLDMSWRQRLLSTIAHPQIAYLLFSLGTLGLTIELWSPGAVLPGVVGGLCLLLAFFAFQVLPVNLVGLLLVLFGLMLLVLEVKVAGFGLLAIGGIVSLVLGSMMMVDSPLPELQVGLSVIVPVAFAASAIILVLVRLAVRAQQQGAVTGSAGMVGERGQALSDIPAGGIGRVSAHGETWNARSSDAIVTGEGIDVVAVDGLVLHVRRQAHGGVEETK